MTRFTKVLAAIILMTAVLFVSGCKPEDDPNNGGGNNNGGDNGGGSNSEVTLITSTPRDVTTTSAVCGGVVAVLEGVTLNEVGVCWGIDPTPTVVGAHVSAGSVEEVFTCTINGLDPETKYYVRAYAWCGEKFYYGNAKDFTTKKGISGTYNGHEYVDLGLPSGTLWATCNVGATTPEGYGDYFAWGEIEPKTTYNWSTFKYADGYYKSLTKYCNNSDYGHHGFTDNLTVLQVSDDAATANWGSGWRIPTVDQWQELYWKTTSTWMTWNGVKGRLFTASNGQSLFLPAAGERLDDEFYDDGNGGYWSSMLGEVNPDGAWDLIFSSGHCFMNYDSDRAAGYSVRAVCSAR